jgi:hypothetical protein
MLLPFSKLASRFPGKQKSGRLHPDTLLRWHVAGLRSTTGARVRLRAVKVGGRWCSCRRWLKEFFAAVEGAPPPEIETRRQVAAREAEVAAQLERRGMKRRLPDAFYEAAGVPVPP